MQIERLQLGPMANFVYLLVPDDPTRLAIVDPAWDPGQLLARAEALDRPITDIILTHHHPDHRNGVEALLERHGARVHVQRAELPWLGGLGWTGDLHLHEAGDTLDLGQGASVKLLHTPGHTPGSQCLLVGDRILTGDTLFIDGCGRCDLPGGDAATLYHSLDRVLGGLDGGVRVLPGHDYAPVQDATLDEQRQTNPYLQFHTMADFVAWRMRPRR
jgi:hydroxyacylglutathione hydrolase